MTNKGLLYYPGIRPVIDARGLCEVFGIGPSKTPGCGVFQNIDEVKPGHFMKFSPYGMTDFTYYRITSNPHPDLFVLSSQAGSTHQSSAAYAPQNSGSKGKSCTLSHLISKIILNISSQMHSSRSRIDHM